MTLRDKLKFWILLCNYVEKVVSGTSPLTLDSAVANSLFYVKAFGGTEQRNLPDGYIQRQFIYMMDGSYLLTDIVPTSDMRIEMDFQTTTIPAGRTAFYLGARTGNAGDGISFGHDSGNNFQVDGFTGTRFLDTATHFSNNTRYLFSWNNGVVKLLKDNVVASTNTFNPTLTTTFPLAIDGYNIEGSINSNIEGIYLYSFKVWNAQGVLVADYVPAIQRGTVPVVGFYDTVSKTFKTATAGTFAAGGEAVPNPDTPMDIVSNNGVLKARHASGLPLGYTLLEYIESSGTQYIDTGYRKYTEGNIYRLASKVSWGDVQTRQVQGVQDYFYYGVVDGYFQIAQPSRDYISTQPALVNTIYETDVTFDALNNNATYSINGSPTNAIQRTFLNVADGSSFFVFSLNTGILPFNSAKVYYYKLYHNGALVRNMIPTKRNSDNVIGMYDTVSGQFFTNAGTGVFVAGNTVSDPVEIYADGVVETIGIRSPNLFDANACTDNYYYNVNLEYMGNPLLALSDYIPVTAGRTYTISGNTSITLTLRINFFDSNKTIISQTAVGNLSGDYNETFTVPAGISYVRYSFDKTQKNSQKVSYMTSTATAEMLLSLGDYTDEQEIISGVVTRKLGVKVLDGTEDWELQNASRSVFVIKTLFPADFASNPDNNIGLCTHFTVVARSTTVSSVLEDGQMGWNTNGYLVMRHLASLAEVANFKQYLANQYAAGTPVIIVYPLATETTDTVTGQPMNTVAGDNILEITQASLNGLELEAKYKQSK